MFLYWKGFDTGAFWYFDMTPWLQLDSLNAPAVLERRQSLRCLA